MTDDPRGPSEGLAAALRPVLARLPAALADPAARRAALQAAAALPATLTSGPLGLELRLAGPHRVDLFASAVPGTAAFQDLIDCLQVSPSKWADRAPAADLAAALTRWQDRAGPLPRVARYLLLELDAPAGAGRPKIPSVFLAPRADRDVLLPRQPPNAFQRYPELSIRAAAELAGIWPDPATAQALSQLIAALPAESDIFAIGAMTSRAAGASLRVAIRRLPDDQVAPVLHAAGFAQYAAAVARLASAAPVANRAIAFDVGPGCEDRVGLELSPGVDWKQASTAGWAELLEYVSSLGVAAPDRIDSVLGLVDATSNPLWGLAHVKVAISTQGLLPIGKLYVGVMHREPPVGH